MTERVPGIVEAGPQPEEPARDERKDALMAVAAELEERAFHIQETIRWVKADNVTVANYLGAVAHGLRLGALAARSRS